MHRIFHIKAYEKEHGPHFNEEHARKAVMKMENEDGTRGPHWSIDETTTLASQYGITLGSKFNRYDWFVALNMVYSDYYKVIINITGSNNTKNYVEFAKAWLNDKDIDEGKMWYYYVYVMCDKVREAEMEHYEKEMYKYEDDEEDEEFGRYRRGGRRMGMFGRRHMYDRDDYDRREHEYEHEHDEESKIDALQKEIDELKKVIKQASQMVPPPMKQMLPQDMQDVMDKVDQ